MIQFDEVSFRYGSGESARLALQGLSLQLHQGETVALIGGNGSGKSTLAALCNGLLVPTEGCVTVDGIDTREAARVYDVRAAVGMVFQHPDDQIVATSVEDDVAFGPENLGLDRAEIRRRVDAAISATGLSGLERREPHLLSGGQKQRLVIAGALAMEPRYLILDEPFSMIDATGRHEVAQVLEDMRGEHGILLITHDVAAALGADRVAVLMRGRLVALMEPLELLAARGSFDEWGLELPDLWRLAEALREQGVPVPVECLRVEEMAEALCL